ncbi:zinc-finger domain-containing protein [Gottfriedia acidiceleris]|uniref:zinc-finger domain-containing protein n=1 Tax=Gottfriedia acidiceleris TaxID=371036 RepID=UPI002FFF7AC8
MLERKEILEEIDTLMKTYCDGCFVYKHFRKDHSQKFAQSFCINKCTIGEKIKTIGKQLTSDC